MSDQKIWAQQALTPEGWQNDVLVCVAADGHISTVT
ncbi:MAG: hypothetical protein ACC619_07355, partial [Paracoccaceae bacterium]